MQHRQGECGDLHPDADWLNAPDRLIFSCVAGGLISNMRIGGLIVAKHLV